MHGWPMSMKYCIHDRFIIFRENCLYQNLVISCLFSGSLVVFGMGSCLEFVFGNGDWKSEFFDWLKLVLVILIKRVIILDFLLYVSKFLSHFCVFRVWNH